MIYGHYMGNKSKFFTRGIQKKEVKTEDRKVKGVCDFENKYYFLIESIILIYFYKTMIS
jgi:hypothetical protein